MELSGKICKSFFSRTPFCSHVMIFQHASNECNVDRQLLYYPFTPYFVLFGNIIRAPFSETCGDDIKLLQSAVSYYSRMASNPSSNNIPRKLEKIAHVFASLAEVYVRDAVSRNTANTLNGNLHTPGIFSAELQNDPSSNPLPGTTTSFDADISQNFDFDFTMDADYLLNWISGPDTMQPSESTEQYPLEIDPHVQAQPPVNSISAPIGSVVNACPSDVFRSLENRGRKRPLECTFDWFSWDMNNPGQGTEGERS